MRRDLLTIPYPRTIDAARAEGFTLIRDVTDGSVKYPCPDPDWSVHLTTWRRLRQSGVDRRAVPEPMPAGHWMFKNPIAYSCVPIDEVRPAKIRRAHRSRVIGDLHGWDTDLRQTPAGMRQLARIVRATVAAKMTGAELGGAPFLACLTAGL